METLQELYSFYIENCVDEDKNEIPLSYKEWVLNYGKQELEFNRYKQNLRIEGNKVISYITHVATIKGCELHQLGYWSMTTQKHINYVAKELNLNLIK